MTAVLIGNVKDRGDPLVRGLAGVAAPTLGFLSVDETAGFVSYETKGL